MLLWSVIGGKPLSASTNQVGLDLSSDQVAVGRFAKFLESQQPLFLNGTQKRAPLHA